MPTPEQIDPTKVTARRAIAAIIDGLIIAIPTILVITASFEYIEGFPSGFCDRFMDEGNGFCVELGDRAYFTRDISPAANLIGFALSLGVYVILQGLTGFTPGKLLTGIRNVREDGRAPGILKALVRWLLWIVDGFPYIFPLVGLITALSTPGHRRVGDMAAKTFVVRAAAKGSPILVPGMTAPVVPAYAGAPGGWSAPPPPGGSWAPPPGAAPQAPQPQGAPQPSSDPSHAGWAAPTSAPSSPAWPVGGDQAAPPSGDTSPDETEARPDAPAHAASTEPPTDRGGAETAGAAGASPAHATSPAAAEPDATDTDARPSASDAPGSASPAAAGQADSGEATAVGPAAAPEPQWDAARGTYIQWDPAQQRWLQWDEAASSWVVIPGQ